MLVRKNNATVVSFAGKEFVSPPFAIDADVLNMGQQTFKIIEDQGVAIPPCKSVTDIGLGLLG